MRRLQTLLRQPKPLIMGILNVTPDSFSDGGLYQDSDRAVSHALAMVAAGADLIDVGGESTRPGSLPVSEQAQMERVLPVIHALRQQLPPAIAITIDTTRVSVAAAALDAGADAINDVSAAEDDQAMLALAASRDCPIILMHHQGSPLTMQQNPCYDHVTAEVCAFLRLRAEAALQAGITGEQILLDPGIGFGKRREHNLQLLKELDQIVALGYPVLLGTSRKRFMGAICGIDDPARLLPATIATTALGVQSGARIFRVHDVAENRQAADVAAAICSADSADQAG
ncbi:MAG: dihydropteroate synthase [Pseudomonadota bacterium]|jgi:dihydropteroate synthase